MAVAPLVIVCFLVAGGCANDEECENSKLPAKSDDDNPSTDDDDDAADPDGILSEENQEFMDEATDTKRSFGNEVQLLVDGLESVPVRTALLESAVEHINMCALDIAEDDSGWDVAQLLVDKVNEGVEVNVILDWMSQILFQGTTGPIDQMADGGVNVVGYYPPAWEWDVFINKRIHEKLIIVDGKEAIMGGLNVGDHYYHGGISDDGWRDTDVYLKGPAVSDLQERFIDNWIEFNTEVNPYFELENEEKYFPELSEAGNLTTRYVTHTPRHGEFNVNHMYLYAIQMAKEFIYIENPYFCTPDDRRNLLAEAAQNGVDVRVLTNSKETNDLGEPMWYASLYYFQEMLDAGIRIFVMNGQHYEMIHSKTAVIDGIWSTVGSFNMDFRSAYTNSENTINIHGEKFGKQVKELLERDMSDTYSYEITQEFMDNLTEQDLRKMNLYHLLEGFL